MTREEINKWQREYRKKNNNLHTHKYEKTKNGFIMRTYRNMLSRTRGLVKPHLYRKLCILPKDAFYKWALADNTFHKLFEAWEKSGYSRKLSPSINRIDSSKGYDFDNIEWITHSLNSSLGARRKDA